MKIPYKIFAMACPVSHFGDVFRHTLYNERNIMTRIEISRTNKLGYAAVIGMEAYARKAVDRRLFELLKIRASVINGCTFCVDMHMTDGLKVGIPQRVLTAAAAWEHAGDLLTDREKAVLALTDSITKLGDSAVPDSVWNAAAQFFDESEMGALVLAIATINVWNRVAIATRMTPPIDAKHPVA